MRTLLALPVALSLAACSTTSTDRPSDSAHYVAMGSSFAAGAGIGPTRDGTPERCQRATNNYASLLSDDLGLELDDRSCGGARTEHVLDPWDELPPQIEGVDAETRLVTVTIGGNDINYVGLLFAASCDERGMAEMMGGACPDELPAPTEAAYVQLAADMRAIADAVKTRAPEATLVFVQYVSLVPPQPCDESPLSREEALMMRGMADRLAAITAATARDVGALLLPVHQTSMAHLPCSSEPWATAFPADHDRSAGAPWHPNAAGHAAIAQQLATLLEREWR